MNTLEKGSQAVVEDAEGIPVQDARHYLTVEEAAVVLRVNKDSIYRLIHEGRLPVLRIGRMMRIDARDFDCLKSGGAR